VGLVTAGCARCGACCDPVAFTRAHYEALVKWSSGELDGIPDPGDDEGWACWQEHGWEDRDGAIYKYAPGGNIRVNADFIAVHWTPAAGGEGCACDMYDRDSRLCTAHDSRPPVCSGYPWYGHDPDSGVSLPLQCSYLADLPRDQRPEGARPLIALTVVSQP